MVMILRIITTLIFPHYLFFSIQQILCNKQMSINLVFKHQQLINIIINLLIKNYTQIFMKSSYQSMQKVPNFPRCLKQVYPAYNNTHIFLQQILKIQTQGEQSNQSSQIKTAQGQQKIQEQQDNQPMGLIHIDSKGKYLNSIILYGGYYQLGMISGQEVIVFGIYTDDEKKKQFKLFVWNLVDYQVKDIQYTSEDAPITCFQLLTFRISKLFCVCQAMINQQVETECVKLTYYSVNIEDNETKLSQSSEVLQKNQQKQQQEYENQQNIEKNTSNQKLNDQNSQQQITHDQHTKQNHHQQNQVLTQPIPQNPEKLTAASTSTPTSKSKTKIKIQLLHQSIIKTTQKQQDFNEFGIIKINQYSCIGFIDCNSSTKFNYVRLIQLQQKQVVGKKEFHFKKNSLFFKHIPKKHAAYMRLDDIWQVENQQEKCLYMKFNSLDDDFDGSCYQFCVIWNYKTDKMIYQSWSYQRIFHQQIVGSWRELGRIYNPWGTKYGVKSYHTVYLLQEVNSKYKRTGIKDEPNEKPMKILFPLDKQQIYNQTVHPTFLTNKQFNYRYTTDDKFSITPIDYQQVVFNTLQLNTFFMIEMMQEGGCECECECDEDLMMKVCELRPE